MIHTGSKIIFVLYQFWLFISWEWNDLGGLTPNSTTLSTKKKREKKQQNRKLHSNDVFNNDNLIGGIFQWHQFLITARSMALQRSVSLQCTWLRQGLSGSQQHRLLNSGSPNFSYSFSESAWPAQMRLLAGQNGPLLFWKCSLGGVWRYVKSNILPLHPTGRVNETQFPIRKSSGFHRASPNKN